MVAKTRLQKKDRSRKKAKLIKILQWTYKVMILLKNFGVFKPTDLKKY